MNDDIIKCNSCGQVLISGRGMIAIFRSGTSIECRKCGNKYVFGQKDSLLKSNELVVIAEIDDNYV